MKDEHLRNFGMLIPSKSVSPEINPDPNGVPVYAQCPANGLCACTGACRKIIGYDTDPEKVRAYHESIGRYNELMKKRLSSFEGKWDT